MKILAYTLTYPTKNEVDLINELFFNGLDYLHIHKPKIKKADLIKLIDSIDSKYHSKIVLHQHYSLAKKYNCEVVHLSLKKLNSFFYKLFLKYLKFSNPNLKISTTIIPSKLSKVDGLDLKYVLVGPIFKKYSEENVRMLFDRFKLKKWISASNKKCFAFGSVDLGNIKSINKLEFEGVVLNSAVWKSHQPIEDFKRLVIKVQSDKDGLKSKVI